MSDTKVTSSENNANIRTTTVTTTTTTTKSTDAPLDSAVPAKPSNGNDPEQDPKKNKKFHLFSWRPASFTLGIVCIVFFVINFSISSRVQWVLYVGIFLVLYPICSLYLFKKKD